MGTELFRREKGQPTKKTGKTRMGKLRVSSGMVHQFGETLYYQFNATKFSEVELARSYSRIKLLKQFGQMS